MPSASTAYRAGLQTPPVLVLLRVASLGVIALMLTARSAAIKYLMVPPGEAAHFISPRSDKSMSEALTSHLLPTYARVDLAFERGEGVWLTADQRRPLSRFHLRGGGQRARPCASASRRGDRRAGPEGHGTFPTCIASPRPSGWPNGYAPRPSPIWCSSAIPAPKRWNAPSRRRASTSPQAATRALPHHHLRGRVPRPHAGDARGRRPDKKYLDGFGPVVDGFDQMPFGDLEAIKRAIGPADRRHPDRADQGEGGVRVGAA